MNNEEFLTISIHEYLEDDKENSEKYLNKLFSEFLCSKNSDVEKFLKERSIEFTKKHQSVTHLVVSSKTGDLVGYFTLTIKPIKIAMSKFTSSFNRKISRVAELDEENNMYSLSAYLIAQLGKNFNNQSKDTISGEQLLNLAIDTIKDCQFTVGGMVVFLEAERNEKLLKFYADNGFNQFDTRQTSTNHELVQLLKIL